MVTSDQLWAGLPHCGLWSRLVSLAGQTCLRASELPGHAATACVTPRASPSAAMSECKMLSGHDDCFAQIRLTVA